jgi:fucose permease
MFNQWRLGYIIVGSAQILLACVFALTIPAWKRTKAPEEKKRILDYKTPMRETLKQSGTWFSLLLFFIYVGIEVTVGSWTYTLLTESRQIASEVAGLWAGSYWGMFTVGRILAGLLMHRLKVRPLLIICMLTALTAAVMLWWNPADWVSLASVAVIGFAVAPIFPGMVSTTSDRVSKAHTANTIGMQISATGLAVAIIPGFAGVLARRISLEIIPIYLTVLIVFLLVIFTVSKKRSQAEPATD